jgi:hypothetical protein
MKILIGINPNGYNNLRAKSMKISKNSENIDDIWAKRFQQSLEKSAVQSREVDRNLFDQINSVLGNKSKYPSVQAAVDDMKNRSGLTAYLNKKMSDEKEEKVVKKTAAPSADGNSVIDKKVDVTPIVFKKHPQIEETIRNHIKSTRGNNSIPAIILKVKTIHGNDVSDASDWEDDNLVRYVSHANLVEKSNHCHDNEFQGLGIVENVSSDNADPANTDAFHILMPAKI